MMKKLLLSLLAACAFGTSWGQTVVDVITINHNELEKTAYSESWEEVDVASVCTSLGITDISQATYKVALPDGNGGYTYEDATTDGWRNPSDATQLGWGNAGVICTKVWADNGHTTGNITYIGCFDASHNAGESYTFPWAFIANDKAVILNVVVTFVAEIIPEYHPTILETINLSHEYYAGASYGDGVKEAYCSFDAASIAQTLGVASLTDAGVSTWIVNPDGNFVENTTDGWRGENGYRTGWPAATNGFCVKIDLGNSRLFDLLAHDQNFAAGDTYTAKWGIVYNDQAVVLNVAINFISPLATPETTLSNLTIVGSKELTVDMAPMTTYTPTTFTVDIAEAASLLGTNANNLRAGFASAIFSKQWNEEKTAKQDQLIGGGNFQYWAAEGEAEVAHATWSWEHAYGITEMTCDGSSITGKLNQIPGRLTAGQSFYNYMYLIVGTNAYQIKVNLNVVEPSLDDMTEAGTKSITLSQVISQATATTYDMTAETPTLAEIATALGCAEGELRLYALDAEGKLSSNHTANNGGYWMDKDGRICGWATENCGLFVEPVSVSDCSTLTVGQFDNTYTEPATWTTTLYVVNTSGNNYYTLNLTVNLTMGDISLSENDTELADINGQRANVELSRTFFEGWNTLVLPFDVSMGDLLSSTGLEVVEIGTFAGDELTDETYHIHFNKLANDVTLVANTPYMINFSGDFDGDISVSNAKINVGEPKAEGTNFDFVGTYVQGELIAADDYYVGSENSFWKSGKARTTKGYRAFLKAKSATGAPARIAFDFGDGTATAIDTLDGEQLNTGDGAWYTLSGVRIAAPTTKGLYIKNGKKYFVK